MLEAVAEIHLFIVLEYTEHWDVVWPSLLQLLVAFLADDACIIEDRSRYL